MKSVMLAADLLVIPVQPSPYDVWAAEETVKLIEEATVLPNERQNYHIARTAAKELIFGHRQPMWPDVFNPLCL